MVIILTALAAILAAGLLYQVTGLDRDRRRFPPPGRLIDIGGYRLHLYEEGMADPSVILEAGIAGSLLGWSLVQNRIAEFTRVCSYDRAGLGWSPEASHPRTLERMTSELEELLHADGFDFTHDVWGIRRHINRKTGQLEDCFTPRYAKR